MKIYICTVIGILFQYQMCIAQIGINTENPQSILHIDVLKNNTGSIPSTAQQNDDVYMGINNNDEAVLSLGVIPNGSAQLELKDANKAFYPNRVALTSQTDVSTVSNPVTGMLVWNTARVPGANGVLPGLYVYENDKWQYLFTEDTKKLQIRYLQTPFVTTSCISSEYDCTFPMDFGEDIIISDDGAYGVGINLYGRPSTDLAAPVRQIIYIWLFSNGVPVDVAELNPIGFADGAQFTYTVFLGGQFNVGDRLTCRLSHYSNTTPAYLYARPNNPDTTFMFYWRLEQSNSI